MRSRHKHKSDSGKHCKESTYYVNQKILTVFFAIRFITEYASVNAAESTEKIPAGTFLFDS